MTNGKHLKILKTEEITSYFSNYISSINNEEDRIFMSYQNKENKEFTKEQERWLKEIKYRRKEGFIFEPKIVSSEKTNHNTGYLNMSLRIIRPSGRERVLKGKFLVIKNESNEWVINDFRFLELARKDYLVKYFKGNEEEAYFADEYINGVLTKYKKLFKWAPNEVSIKIFDSLDQISLSIPTFAIYGWNEEGEAIKVLVPQYVQDKTEFLQNLLSHELSHKMLSNLTNDNASLYIQEGLAVYLEKSNSGVVFGEEGLKKHRIDVIKQINGKFKSVNELNLLDYDDGEKIYYHGFLLVYFLIENFGIDRFLDFTNLLSCYKYEDTRVEYKLSIINERTLESLDIIYGDLDELSFQMINFFKKELN